MAEQCDDETPELIEGDAMREENRIVQQWRQGLYLRAQAIARETGSRQRGAVLIKREHYLVAAMEIMDKSSEQ